MLAGLRAGGLWRGRCRRSWNRSAFCWVVLRCAGLCLVLLILTPAQLGIYPDGGVVVAGFASVCPEPACTSALVHDDPACPGR